MTLWIIEPLDPLIFGDGKPFSAIPGARAKSLPFPHPPTVAGSMRTHAGPGVSGQFDTPRTDELLAKQVRGPVLVEIDSGGHISDWLLPAPADALLLRTVQPTEAQRLWLRPIAPRLEPPPTLWGWRLSGRAKWQGRSRTLSRPPIGGGRRLPNGCRRRATARSRSTSLGHSGPQRESRVHVSIRPDSQTALEGALFQTSGLEFLRAMREADQDGLGDVRTLALALETDADLQDGIDFLGGERRIVHWQKVAGDLPVCPDEVRQPIVRDRACRLILVTPAYFAQGLLPTWLLSCASGAEATIVAAAVPRYQTASGWDYKKRQPKPTCRLAPAGSVYFVKLTEDNDAINRFVDAVWMRTVSDEAQARLDGFGLAVLGAWDGKLHEMEVKS